MKYLSLALLSILITSASYCQCTGIGNNLFDSTLNLVYKQAPAHGDATGLEQAIEENIYKICYETPDSVVSLERKLDILCLAIYFGRQNADPVKGKIRYKFLNNDPIVTRRIIFLLPMAFTRYDSGEVGRIIIALNKDSLINATTGITPYYTKYFNYVIDYIYKFKTSSEKYNGETWEEGLNLEIQLDLLRNKEFQKKYPCFKPYLKRAGIYVWEY